MSASVTASRFALLKIEGSDDEEKSRKNTQKSKDPRAKSAQKKKSKKKQNAEAADLRSLAFGGGGGKSSTAGRPSSQPVAANTQQEQYHSWVEHDKDQVDELFKDEIQQAMLLSKVESQKQMTLSAEHMKTAIAASLQDEQSTTDGNTKKKGKGKNKAKQKSMSIGEFQHGPAQPEHKLEVDAHRRKISANGEDIWTEVATDAADMVRKDKLREEYEKQYKVQAVLQAKHNTELEVRDAEIEQLKTDLSESQDELKGVKKRNKQLCFILAQGEMKEKAEILQQVDSLSQIKDELTAQVSSLTSELEKERSKVHALQNDITKMKHKAK